jgi:hypothetical protein
MDYFFVYKKYSGGGLFAGIDLASCIGSAKEKKSEQEEQTDGA